MIHVEKYVQVGVKDQSHWGEKEVARLPLVERYTKSNVQASS
jgi:hypothetical protein